MRTSVKFCLVLMMMCLSFVLLSVAVVENGLSAVKQADYEAVASVIAAVQEKYPEVSEQDIIAILNHATTSSQKKAADDMLKKYGITPEQTVVQSNREANVRMTLMIAGVGLLFSVSVLVFFWLFVRYKVRQECHLTRYLSRINAGSFELPKEKLTEDKSSVLSDEIYKTTLMLREKSEQSHRDKAALKDSLTDISHQLKTPLTSMLIMLDNIIEDDLPEEVRNEFLNDIRESVHHISFLTYSLLKLSKLDANSIEFDIQPVSMKELFMTAIGRTSAIAAERGVALVQECENITIRCDKRWLSEALTNIVKNWRIPLYIPEWLSRITEAALTRMICRISLNVSIKARMPMKTALVLAFPCRNPSLKNAAVISRLFPPLIKARPLSSSFSNYSWCWDTVAIRR